MRSLIVVCQSCAHEWQAVDPRRAQGRQWIEDLKRARCPRCHADRPLIRGGR
jgi:Zn finger protein HypA/HybF involved in hydrogenase expression